MAKKKEQAPKKNYLMGLLMFAIILFFISYMVVFFVGRSRSTSGEKANIEKRDYDLAVKKIAVKEDRVQTSINNYNSFNFGEEVYHLDSLSVEDVPMYNYIVGALANINSDKVAYCIADNSGLKDPVTLDEINETVHKLGDINISYEDLYNNAKESSNAVGNLGYGFYSILTMDGNLYVIGACDAVPSEQPYVVIEEQAEEFEDYINIYQRVAFGVRKGEKIAYYDNYQREGYSKETLSEGEKPHFSKYQYALYKITFLKVGDNYYFQGIVSRS